MADQQVYAAALQVAMLGIGRGLSRREFGPLGIPMEESRERVDEAAPMILDARETGVMEEHHGRFYDQPRADLDRGRHRHHRQPERCVMLPAGRHLRKKLSALKRGVVMAVVSATTVKAVNAGR